MRFCLEVVDGADAVRTAAREQLRQGADQIKIMVSGGVASPYDPLDSRQFSLEEIGAAVEEAEAFGRYAQAHAYTPDAITRAVTKGVRTIEHGNLIDDESAKLMKQKGAYLVANLVAYYAMKERAKEFGMTSEMLAKNDLVIDGGLESLEICKRHGIKVGYGSDLLGALQVDQSREFLLRREVLWPEYEIIRQATLVGAEIVRMQGKLGELKPGAFADVLVVDGDPIKKLELLTGQGRSLGHHEGRPLPQESVGAVSGEARRAASKRESAPGRRHANARLRATDTRRRRCERRGRAGPGNARDGARVHRRVRPASAASRCAAPQGLGYARDPDADPVRLLAVLLFQRDRDVSAAGLHAALVRARLRPEQFRQRVSSRACRSASSR